MFSTAPCNPWEGQDWVNVLVETARSGALTLSGFLAKWSYMAMKVRAGLATAAPQWLGTGGPWCFLLHCGFIAATPPQDPRSTLANAMYLGYTGDASQLLCVSKRRRQERKTDQAGRSVLQCYVVGGPGAHQHHRRPFS